MHDIWNPWHGCVKVSEGCRNCYMYFLDRTRGKNGRDIYRTGAGFEYPLRRTRSGAYAIRSGELIRVCMTSDFFLPEADRWRPRAWSIMRERSDVIFYLLTKRPERVLAHLPQDWGDGWENIWFNVTAENQRRADERVPQLLDLPFRHKGVACSPFIGEVSLERWLGTGQIEYVSCGGENYDGARPCRFEWVQRLRRECEASDVSFCFFETGTVFVKDGKLYRLPDKQLQSRMAKKSCMSYEGRPMRFKLTYGLGVPVPESELYRRHFRKSCETCGSRPMCNGCSDCGRCEK